MKRESLFVSNSLFITIYNFKYKLRIRIHRIFKQNDASFILFADSNNAYDIQNELLNNYFNSKDQYFFTDRPIFFNASIAVSFSSSESTDIIWSISF